jgi:arabinofuranosyltransferase
LSRAARLALPGLLLAVTAVVIVRTAWMCDDAAITLRSIDHLVQGHGLRWNAAERVQTFTHPLWLLLLTIPYAVTREPYFTVLFVSGALSLLVTALLLLRRDATSGGLVATALALLVSRAFVDYATSGLENPLTHLLLVLFVGVLARETPGERRFVRLGLLTALLAVNRLDAVLLVAPAMLLESRALPWRRALALAPIALAPFLLWEAFSLFYYGLLVPNTAVAKLHTGIPAGELAGQGLAYLANSLRDDPATLAITGTGILLAFVRGGATERALAAGAALYLGYVVRIGGDFMSGRFLTAPFLVGLLLFPRLRLPRLRPSGPGLLPWAAVAALTGLFVLTPHPSATSGPGFGAHHEGLIDERGIADERRYYYGRSGLLAPGRALPRPAYDSARTGLLARRLGTPLLPEGGIGFTGYFAGPRVHVLDYYALADPLLARLPVVTEDPHGYTAKGLGWRSGHFLRNVPKGYLATLLTGRNQIEDPELARLYDRIARITHGPLLDGGRLGEIARLNLGIDLPPMPAARPAYAGIDWDEMLRARPDLAEAYYGRGVEALDRWKADPARGDLARARSDFERAAALAPDHLFALIELARLEIKSGEVERARRRLEHVVALEPGELLAWVDLGEIAMRGDDPQGAVRAYREVVRLDPTLGMGWNNLASAAYALGRTPEAIGALERLVRLDPRAPQPLEDLGRLYLEAGDEERGLAMLRRSARRGHTSAQEELRARGERW